MLCVLCVQIKTSFFSIKKEVVLSSNWFGFLFLIFKYIEKFSSALLCSEMKCGRGGRPYHQSLHLSLLIAKSPNVFNRYGLPLFKCLNPFNI